MTRILRHCKLASVPPPICTCPFAPSNVRLGRLSPRRRAWSQKQRAPSAGLSHTSARWKSHHPLPPCILSCLSRPCGAGLHLALGRAGGQRRTAREERWHGVAAGRGALGAFPRGRCKSAFKLNDPPKG